MVESKALDTTGLQGSAKRGLISKSDVVLGIKSGQVKEDDVKKKMLSQALTKPVSTIAVTAPVIISPQAPINAFPATTVNAATLLEISQKPVSDRYVDIPNSNMRKVIAKRLTESKSTVPHFYTSIECEVDDLMKLRKRLQSDFDVNVSVNDLVIKSAALALRDVPRVNSKWSKQLNAIDSSMSHRVDISVAVATPNGLITPIVTDADKRGLADINSTVKDLATRARDGKLKPDEYQGGSFSISNLGMFGISSFSAVINPPQACILAVGAGIKKVLPPKLPTEGVSGDSKPKPRVVTTVTVQLSADRRVVDEAVASQFLQVFQGYLSNPVTMLL